MEYSSKDFSKTTAKLVSQKATPLIHQQVCHHNQNEAFSAERQHPVFVVDLPSKTISMTLGGLDPHQHTNEHRHTYETLIYIQQGSGFSMIDGERVDWTAGDAIYIPMWAWHSHHNATAQSCLYIACENTPLLQNLGVALREEK